MIRAVPVLIIFGKPHFLLISENEFNHEIKCDGITSFMDFMCWLSAMKSYVSFHKESDCHFFVSTAALMSKLAEASGRVGQS